MTKRILPLFLALVFILAACSEGVPTATVTPDGTPRTASPTTSPTAPSTAQPTVPSTATASPPPPFYTPTFSPTPSALPTLLPTNTPAPTPQRPTPTPAPTLQPIPRPATRTRAEAIRAIRLSVSEGYYIHEKPIHTIAGRLDDYKAAGIITIRIDANYHKPSSGVWILPDATKHIIEAAVERGLNIKLILQTVKDPPEWLLRNENARFKDSNGNLAWSAVSFWWDGLHDYLEMALRAQLNELRKYGLLDAIGSIQIDLGPWGEPGYPHATTEHPGQADAAQAPGVVLDEVFWCYGDNAVADFRVKMQTKYGTIAAANQAWGTSYANFAALSPPKEGEASGRLWEDMMTWYVQVKRDFVDWQVRMFVRVVSEYYEDMPLVIFTLGGEITQAEWDISVRYGTATTGIKWARDDKQIVDLAYEHNLFVQHGGLETREDPWLRHLLNYIGTSGKTSIPVFAENPGSIHNDNLPANKVDLVRFFGLNGYCYMWARYLYEADGVTKTPYFNSLRDNVARFNQAFDNPVRWVPPQPQARGDVLRYDVTFGRATGNDIAFSFSRIKTMNYTVAAGDVLEYDVFFNALFPGFGAVDGMIGGNTIRDNLDNVDQNGFNAHPNNDLTYFAYKEWFHRKLDISNPANIGKQLTEIQLATHPGFVSHPLGSPVEFSGQSVTIWYDNIRITNNGQVKLVIFESAGDIDLSKVELVASRNVVSAAVRIVDASDAK